MKRKKQIINVESAIQRLKDGLMIIIVDDENRENEGDLMIASDKVSPEAINFMAIHGRGLICASLTHARSEELSLPLMVQDLGNTSHFQTPFTVSIDANMNTTTGISAHDRFETIRCIVNPKTRPSDLTRPGHIFPLRARDGGVLVRAGQTEASVDLCRIAGLYPSGVICEIMKDDGSMARMPDLLVFSEKHDIPIITIEEIIKYRLKQEKLIELEAEAKLPTEYGEFVLQAYRDVINKDIHLALIKGDLSGQEPVLVRVHSQCLTGDTFASQRCDCGSQLHQAMKAVNDAGRGVILYLINHEGRGIGLLNKLKAYKLQENGRDTVEANLELGFKEDQRDYGIGAQILKMLGLKKLRLMTNNPSKYIALSGYGLEIVERLPIEVSLCKATEPYLKTKKEKMGHLLSTV